MPTLTDLTPEVLRDLYCNQLLSEAAIAEQFGTYQIKINRLRKKWGIETLGKAKRNDSALPPLTPPQQELLVGSLLGDGYMSASSETTARYCESHAIKQQDYLQWKAAQLGPYVLSISNTEKHEGDKVFQGVRLNGITCTAMRELYDLFYPAPARKRMFPASLSTLMTPLALAVWYMDDGGLFSRYHPRITFGLDDLSLSRALKALRKLGLRPQVNTGNGARTITFPGQSDLFFNLVGPHIPDCMSYKKPEPDTERRLVDRNAKRLTPERAVTLYQGGASLDQIASFYKVAKSTVKRRLVAQGLLLRGPGTSAKVTSREVVAAMLAPYTPTAWVDLSEADKERWVLEVASILRDGGFPYPLHLSQDQFDRAITLTRQSPMRLEGGVIRPWTSTGSNICLPYFPNRYKAASRGQRTAFEAWHDDSMLRWAVRFQLDAGDPVLPHRVLRAVTMQHRTPSVFRPTVALWVYRTYCPAGGTVWDPCAGYGGRVLGALLAGVQYIGTDVEPETVAGNQALAEKVGGAAKVHLCPAEQFDPGPVDLVFTSPPYFDRELYSGRNEQSYVSHGADFDGWVEGFLRPVIQTAHRRLASGRHLILNVADIRKGRTLIPLVDRTIQAVLAEGFTLQDKLWMPLARLNRSPEKAREPVLVFVRN